MPALFLFLILAVNCQLEIQNDQIGRLDALDKIIDKPDVLKAIAFSVRSKDTIYKEVLDETIADIKKQKKYIHEDSLSGYKYYIDVLKNVQKYTAKWLREELEHLNLKAKENPHELTTIKKRNIAGFIYHTASEFGMDLVLNGDNTSLDDWKKRHDEKISILKKNFRLEEL